MVRTRQLRLQASEAVDAPRRIAHGTMTSNWPELLSWCGWGREVGIGEGEGVPVLCAMWYAVPVECVEGYVMHDYDP